MSKTRTTYKEKWTNFANTFLRDPLDNIVFRNRNKGFGAYELRLLSNKALLWSVLFSATTFCSYIVGTSLYFHSKDEEYEEDLTVVEYIAFDSSIPKLNIPKGDKNASSDKKEPTKEEKQKEETPKKEKPSTTNATPTVKEKAKDPDSSSSDSKKDTANASATKGDTSGKDDKGGFSVGSEESAQPIGGKDEFAKYVSQHIKYPEELKKDKVEGTVYVSFTVDSTGSVIQAQVLRGLNKLLDAEVLRAVKAAPKWIPARQAGRPTFQRFNIGFKIHAP